MIQKIVFKKGDLVLYDRFGSYHETVSPSVFVDDFAIGLIVSVVEECEGQFDSSYAEIIKEDGSKGFFSLSYLNSFPLK